MRGWDERSEVLFRYVNCQARVPKDHPLRAVLRIVDAALAALLLSNFFKKRPCRFEIGRVKTLGKSLVGRRKQLTRLFAPALVAPYPRKAGGGAQFPRQGPLPPRPVEGLPEVILGCCDCVRRVFQ